MVHFAQVDGREYTFARDGKYDYIVYNYATGESSRYSSRRRLVWAMRHNAVS